MCCVILELICEQSFMVGVLGIMQYSLSISSYILDMWFSGIVSYSLIQFTWNFTKFCKSLKKMLKLGKFTNKIKLALDEQNLINKISHILEATFIIIDNLILLIIAKLICMDEMFWKTFKYCISIISNVLQYRINATSKTNDIYSHINASYVVKINEISYTVLSFKIFIAINKLKLAGIGNYVQFIIVDCASFACSILSTISVCLKLCAAHQTKLKQ
jgi:hypothetical protein